MQLREHVTNALICTWGKHGIFVMGFLPWALAAKLILHQILCSSYRVPCPWEDRQQNTEDLPRKPIALAAPPEPGEKLPPCCAPPQDRPAPAQAITGTFPAHTLAPTGCPGSSAVQEPRPIASASLQPLGQVSISPKPSSFPWGIFTRWPQPAERSQGDTCPVSWKAPNFRIVS